MTDLLPCPFCSAPAHLEEDSPPRAGFKIHASCGPDCKAQPSVWAEYADEAIAAWNTRSPLRSGTPGDGKLLGIIKWWRESWLPGCVDEKARKTCEAILADLDALARLQSTGRMG